MPPTGFFLIFFLAHLLYLFSMGRLFLNGTSRILYLVPSERVEFGSFIGKNLFYLVAVCLFNFASHNSSKILFYSIVKHLHSVDYNI